MFSSLYLPLHQLIQRTCFSWLSYKGGDLMFSECMAEVWLSVSCYLLLELQGVFHLPLEQTVVSR